MDVTAWEFACEIQEGGERELLINRGRRWDVEIMLRGLIDGISCLDRSRL